jgi:hypothetical protein
MARIGLLIGDGNAGAEQNCHGAQGISKRMAESHGQSTQDFAQRGAWDLK